MLQQKLGRTNCPTKVAILSDIGKFWAAIVRRPTVICSPALVERLSPEFHLELVMFGQSFSLRHYPPIYQPPEVAYLLNIDTVHWFKSCLHLEISDYPFSDDFLLYCKVHFETTVFVQFSQNADGNSHFTTLNQFGLQG